MKLLPISFPLSQAKLHLQAKRSAAVPIPRARMDFDLEEANLSEFFNFYHTNRLYSCLKSKKLHVNLRNALLSGATNAIFCKNALILNNHEKLNSTHNVYHKKFSL